MATRPGPMTKNTEPFGPSYFSTQPAPRGLNMKGHKLLCGSPPQNALGKAGRSRDWNYVSSKSHIHRIADRRAHGIAAGGRGVREGGSVRAEIMVLRVGLCSGWISASVNLT